MQGSVRRERAAHDVAQRALVVGREPRPRSSRRSTIPVTLELSQCSRSASSLIGLGSSGSSRRNAWTCGGESSNSEAIAPKRRLDCCSSRNISPHASEAGETRRLACVPTSRWYLSGYIVDHFKYIWDAQGMTNDQGILVERLVRTFKGDITAVAGIDLEVTPGEIYGFLGPNGAGKSTTVHMLTTLLPPTAGRARVAGYDVATHGADVRRNVGAALQEAALDAFLTGREHMDLQAGLNGLSKSERARRGTALLERVGLTDAADRKVGGYSGGMKRRLDLAMALVHGPSILFLDEPTTGLDPQSRSALWDEVQRLATDEGVTVFLTTQYLEEADVLADRVGIIDRGHIVAEGTPAVLKDEIGRPSVEAIPQDPEDLGRM